MTIKTILVPLGDPEVSASPLAAALAVAGLFGAHVEALHVRADPRDAIVDYIGETMSGQLIEEVMKATETNAAELAATTRKMFDDACARESIAIAEAAPGPGTVSASWREETGLEDRWVEHRGRLADLTVIGRAGDELEVSQRLSMEAAIMGTGRPLLVVPPTAPAAIGKHVVIAWNGSAEASRGLAAAMPFLNLADAVTVLSAKEESNGAYHPEDVVAYLAWHDVRAEAANIAVTGDSVGAALLADAMGRGADLMVMGAYTHSRLREMILGGVTRHILNDTDLAVLMAH